MDTKLIVSASPHVRSEETTQSLMAASKGLNGFAR